MADSGYLAWFEEAANSEDAGINMKDAFGKTPLMYATINGHKNMIEFLIEVGANINLTDKDGKTAYDLARNSGKLNNDLEKLLKPSEPVSPKNQKIYKEAL